MALCVAKRYLTDGILQSGQPLLVLAAKQVRTLSPVTERPVDWFKQVFFAQLSQSIVASAPVCILFKYAVDIKFKMNVNIFEKSVCVNIKHSYSNYIKYLRIVFKQSNQEPEKNVLCLLHDVRGYHKQAALGTPETKGFDFNTQTTALSIT